MRRLPAQGLAAPIRPVGGGTKRHVQMTERFLDSAIARGFNAAPFDRPPAPAGALAAAPAGTRVELSWRASTRRQVAGRVRRDRASRAAVTGVAAARAVCRRGCSIGKAAMNITLRFGPATLPGNGCDDDAPATAADLTGSHVPLSPP